MNQLSYKINKQNLLHRSSLSDEGFQVVLDGDLAYNWFYNIDELKRSSIQDGIYGIFDGPCSLKGCCGVYMEVIHKDDLIVWKRFFEVTEIDRESDNPILMPDDNDAYEVKTLSFCKDKYLTLPLEFRKDDYLRLVQDIEVAIKQ